MDRTNLGSAIPLAEPLTEREQEILRLKAEGLSNPEIASRLVLALSTVKWYVRQIYGKLGVEDHHQAVARARTLGLLEPATTPAGRPRYNLPVQTTPLVGRTREMDDLIALLADPEVRLVTVLGPGGIGKTRLALEAAWRLVEPERRGTAWVSFPDGVYFVPLQPLDSPDDILWTVAEAVGYPFQSDGREPQQQLLDFFREKRLLLVMDNFEHLLDGADLVSAILQAAPGMQVLVTSREILNLNAETVYSLGGLPFPGPVEDVLDYDSARLFVQGARRACVGFTLQPDDRPALSRICRLVEGMPLALLLAAAWGEVLSVHDIAEEIARSFDFLTAEMRDAPRRQWSIRAVFEPTWQRLSEAEQDVFMRLSVFRAGCTRQAAQAVTGASLPVLQALVRRALLVRTPTGRYQLHELLRRYGEEQLHASGESESTRDAHCAYYAGFMHARQGDLKGGNRQITALDEIDADFENVRAAWDWSIEQRRVDDLKQMEWSVSWFLTIRGRRAEGLTLFQSALNLDDDRALLGRVMARYAGFCAEMGHWQEWDEWSVQSLGIARETGDPGNLALTLSLRSSVLAQVYRDFEQAHRMVDESLQLWQVLGDMWGVAFGLQTKGMIARSEGDFSSALSYTEEALKTARIVGDRQRMGAGFTNAGVDYRCLGKPQQALQYYQESLAIFRELNAPSGMAMAMGNMGDVAEHLGDYDMALRLREETLALAGELGFLPSVARGLQGIANSLSLTGRFDEAADRLAECHRVVESIEEKESLEAETTTLQAWVAYRRGDYSESLRFAQTTPEHDEVHPFFIQESTYWLLIGLIEIKLNHLDAAQRHIRTSLPGLRMKDNIMCAIYGLAALEAAGGQPERAVELAALVQHHRATPYEFKVYAGELLAELQPVHPPEAYAAAVERSQALDLDAVLAELLAESKP